MARPLSHPDINRVDIHSVLSALADPVRLQIVRLAAEHDELPCKDFFAEIPKSTMSHHWRVLRDAGLIRQRNDGVQKLNSLRKKELDARFPGLLKAVLNAG